MLEFFYVLYVHSMFFSALCLSMFCLSMLWLSMLCPSVLKINKYVKCHYLSIWKNFIPQSMLDEVGCQWCLRYRLTNKRNFQQIFQKTWLVYRFKFYWRIVYWFKFYWRKFQSKNNVGWKYICIVIKMSNFLWRHEEDHSPLCSHLRQAHDSDNQKAKFIYFVEWPVLGSA